MQVDLTDDKDDDFFIDTNNQKPTSSDLLKNDFENIQNFKQQPSMDAPNQNIPAAQIPENSRFSRIPELIPITRTKSSTIAGSSDSSHAEYKHMLEESTLRDSKEIGKLKSILIFIR